MRASEIIPAILEKRELRKQAQVEAPTAVNAGGKAVPNRPLKKRRKPINTPVLMTFSLPQREMLMGETEKPKK